MSAAWPPPAAVPGQVVVDGPHRLRHELAWTLALPAERGGGRAQLALLLPELAADPALRRRWVHEAERLAAVDAPCLPPTLAIGPEPDPRAPTAEPPWRLRVQPTGHTLASELDRGPLPIDRALDVAARLADAVAAVHAAGLVLRDLEPRAVLLGDDGRLWLVDVGQARLAILSSRTASSLMLETSPYAAPEAVRSTTLDGRADVYSVAAILWHALVGAQPRADGLFGPVAASALDLDRLRPGLPAGLAAVVARCLERDPDRRVATAHELAAALRGEPTTTGLVVARVTCQACGQAIQAGLHLCLRCGRESVQLRHDTGDQAMSIVLRSAREDASFVAGLRRVLTPVVAELPHLNFMTGDRRMYDKAERAALHALPLRLFADVEPASATLLVTRLRAEGCAIETMTRAEHARLTRAARHKRWLSGALVLGAIGLAIAGTSLLSILGTAAVALVPFFLAMRDSVRAGRHSAPALSQLRAAPAALPAATPLLARLAALLAPDVEPPVPAEVRPPIEEAAVYLQRLLAACAGDDGRHLPVAPLVEDIVGVIVDAARAVAALDRQLATLDEDRLVRALAAASARREPAATRDHLLVGLDRLRELEDQRATLVRRLLEATALLARAAELGLDAARADRLDDPELRQAALALELDGASR